MLPNPIGAHEVSKVGLEEDRCLQATCSDPVRASLTSNCTPNKAGTHCQIGSKHNCSRKESHVTLSMEEPAVVSAAHGAMGSLLGKLGDLLADKCRLVQGVKGEIMFLKAELEHMHVFLKTISDTEEPDEQDKCWAKEVRELSYDIEDNINEFMLRFECKSESKPCGLFKGFVDRSMNLLTTIYTRYEVAKEFHGLKRRVVEVSERRTRYRIDADRVSELNRTTIDRRLLAIHTESAGLVGVDGPRDELIQLINEEGATSHQLKVLSIVGFGGLGKTTLANEIYRKLESQFQCRAFVSVSQKPNIRKILRTILFKVGFKNNMETWEEFELISALQNFLLDKRYFIVIDDVWESSAWDPIHCSLPQNRNGSRIIITTRIQSVARVCCSNNSEYVYVMKSLNDEDSRKLFFKRILGSDSEIAFPPYFKEVSSDILKKCGGLPLAVITISSLLASQPNKLNVLSWWQYIRNSLGSTLELNPSLEGMRQILNLSYIHLPHCLRTCMLYIAIYPEDYTIDKNDLTRQWIAQGFISKVHGIDLEDVAKSYFNELINRSMIQPTQTDYDGEVLFFRVHDMMLDLILHKSREENFLTVIDNVQEMTVQHDKIRRLSLHLDGAANDDRAVGSVQLTHIRAVARFGIPMYLPPFLLFKHLRVLTIEVPVGRPFTDFLDFTGICHLFQLGYLKIVANNYRVVLPSKIGGLQQLETFHLETNISFSEGIHYQELPSDISHISRLVHLIVPGWRGLPDGLDNMKSLRTLRSLNMCWGSPNNVKVLRELTSLTDLEIGWYHGMGISVSCDEAAARGRVVLNTCLEKFCNLKYLYLRRCPANISLGVSNSVRASFCHLQRFRADVSWFSRVPEWIGELHNLYDLDLAVNEVLDEDVGVLAQLPSLTRLSLHILASPREKITVRGSAFPVLEHFTLICRRVWYLTFEATAMTKLKRLELVFVEKGWDRYDTVPAGIEHLPSLREISLRIGNCCDRESCRQAAESALRNAVDKHPGGTTASIRCDSYSEYIFDDVGHVVYGGYGSYR